MIKQFVIISILFLWCFPVWASEQVIVGGTPNTLTPGGTSTYRQNFYGSIVSNYDTGSSKRHFVAPSAGVLSDLLVNLTAGPGGTYHFTIYNNNSPTSLTVDIADTATQGSDTINTASVSAGDVVGMVVTKTGTMTASYATWSMIFTPTTTDYTWVVGNSRGVDIADGNFLPLIGGGTPHQTEVNKTVVIPGSGTIRNLYVWLKDAPGTDNSRVFTVRKDGVDQTLTCTIADAATTCNDTTHSFTVSAGDLLSLQVVDSGTPIATFSAEGVVFVPDTTGDFIIPMSAANPPEAASTSYAPPCGGPSGTFPTTESNVNLLANAFTLKAIYVNLESAPGAGKSLVFTIRDDAGNTALTTTLSDAETNDGATGSVAVADFSLLDTMVEPSGTPTVGATDISYLGTTVSAAASIFQPIINIH